MAKQASLQSYSQLLHMPSLTINFPTAESFAPEQPAPVRRETSFDSKHEKYKPYRVELRKQPSVQVPPLFRKEGPLQRKNDSYYATNQHSCSNFEAKMVSQSSLNAPKRPYFNFIYSTVQTKQAPAAVEKARRQL